MNPRTILLRRLGTIEYESAWRWQAEKAAAVRAGGHEVLALLQHPPVYTFGRRPRFGHLLAAVEELNMRGASVVASDRGGDVTFHGPGQVVGYPIVHLGRRGLAPGDYIRALEETMIRAARRFGVEGRREYGRPGVWSQDAKIGAVGVRVRGGVAMHGFALNVSVDLSWFDAIVPCGIRDARVTSMTEVLGHDPGLQAVEDAIATAFGAVFEVQLVPASAGMEDTRVAAGAR
jgi:lipoyl(octanoyl) transferase